MTHTTDDLPESLTLDEAYRAAFYFVLGYLSLEKKPSEDIFLFSEYMWTDPARWSDWVDAVRRGLADGGLANPDHAGRWQLRPDRPPLKQEPSE